MPVENKADFHLRRDREWKFLNVHKRELTEYKLLVDEYYFGGKKDEFILARLIQLQNELLNWGLGDSSIEMVADILTEMERPLRLRDVLGSVSEPEMKVVGS